MEARQELEMRGIGAAPGIVAGPVLLLKADDEPLPEYAVDAADVPREMLRLEAALIETRRQLHDVQRRVGEALGQRVRDLQGGNGTVDLVVLAHLGADLQRHGFELLGYGFCVAFDLGGLVRALLHRLGQHLAVGFGRHHGKAARDQEVTGVTGTHLYDFVGIAEVVDVLFQDDFHVRSSFLF